MTCGISLSLCFPLCISHLHSGQRSHVASLRPDCCFGFDMQNGDESCESAQRKSVLFSLPIWGLCRLISGAFDLHYNPKGQRYCIHPKGLVQPSAVSGSCPLKPLWSLGSIVRPHKNEGKEEEVRVVYLTGKRLAMTILNHFSSLVTKMLPCSSRLPGYMFSDKNICL